MMSETCLLLLIVATWACSAYLLPTLFALVPRPFQSHDSILSFAILVPAHNEEATLPITLAALDRIDYPRDLVRVYVVADNCSDRTADLATQSICLVRNDPERRGKGYALEFGLRAILADEPDVVLILDADCLLSPEALGALSAVLSSGAEAAQTVVRSCNADDGPAGYAIAVGTALDDAVAAGLDRLGRSTALRGTGMAFRREVLERVPWTARSATEDAEYDLLLRAAGIRIRYCGGAIVCCAAPVKSEALNQQRRRWQAALLAAGWTHLPMRITRSKPLVLIQLLVTCGACFALGPAWTMWWAAGLLIATSSLYLRAIVEVGVTRNRIGLLARAPLVVARLAYVSLVGLIRRVPGQWEPDCREPQLEERDAICQETSVAETEVDAPVRPAAPVRTRSRPADIRR